MDRLQSIRERWDTKRWEWAMVRVEREEHAPDDIAYLLRLVEAGEALAGGIADEDEWHISASNSKLLLAWRQAREG